MATSPFNNLDGQKYHPEDSHYHRSHDSKHAELEFPHSSYRQYLTESRKYSSAQSLPAHNYSATSPEAHLNLKVTPKTPQNDGSHTQKYSGHASNTITIINGRSAELEF